MIEQEITGAIPEHQRALYNTPPARETPRARIADKRRSRSTPQPRRNASGIDQAEGPLTDPERALLQTAYEADMATADLENGYLALEDTRSSETTS